MTTNELILTETELHEIEAAEDEEGQLNIKMSKRSWGIIMDAIRFVRDLKEMDGDNDTN